jgi:heparan-sulfate lyase
MTELLKYFQTRTNRKMIEMEFDSDTDHADSYVANIISIKNYMHDFSDEINWKLVKSDKEWLFSLNRMNWFRNYIGAYEKTQDEKYVYAWMKQIKSWIAMNEPGFPRSIDTGRRLYNWVISYHMFAEKLKSPVITAEWNADMLLSMYRQAEYLFNPEHWRRYSNWGTFENSGFVFFVLMFPEFKKNNAWLKEAFFRMRFQLENSYHPDGMHVEVSPSYHFHEMEVLFQFLKLADLNNIQNPWRPQIHIPDMKDILLKSAKAGMHWLKPTGYFPQVGDTDHRDERKVLAEIGKNWNQPDLLYVTTNGRKGVKPERESISFPSGGYHILRSGWGSKKKNFEDELYLLFDTNTNQPWHAHLDMLNVVVTAYGHDLLKDSGRYTYNETSERDYFINTSAHNTIVINGQNQNKYCQPFGTQWYSTTGFDYVASSHHGYPGITHRRSIYFVKPEYWIIIDNIDGIGRHRIEQYWHLSDDSMNKTKILDQNEGIETPNMLLYSHSDSLESRIEKKFISYAYRKKRAAPVLINTKTSNLPVCIATVLYPYNDQPPEMKTCSVSSNDTLPIYIENHFPTHTDRFIEQKNENKIVSVNSVRTDARTAFLRVDRNDKILICQLVEGTFLVYNDKPVVNLQGSASTLSVTRNQIELNSEYIARFQINYRFKAPVYLNGEKLLVSYNEEMIQFRD